MRPRSGPGFIMPADPPSKGAAWERTTFRDHVRAWNQQVVGDGNALPHVVYVFIIVTVVILVYLYFHFFSGFYYIVFFPNQTFYLQFIYIVI